MEILRVQIPIRLISEANTTGHWTTKAKRVKDQRGTTSLICKSKLHNKEIKLPLTVTITRIAPRTLDTDNLSSSAKATRDAVADSIGINDKDERVTWLYKQRKKLPNETWTIKEYGVEIVITSTPTF